MAVDDSYTKSLLHFDENLTDESGKTWTAYGGAATSAAGGKFAGRLILDGVDDYISCTHTDFAVGNQTFVAECWFYPGVSETNSMVIAFGDSPNNLFDYHGLYLPSPTNIGVVASTNGTGWATAAYNSITSGQYNHVAMIKSGNVLYLARNGIITNLVTLTGPINQPANKIFIGCNAWVPGGYFAAGSVSEFRLSVGTDRGWTSNFTPPTAPYGTVILPPKKNIIHPSLLSTSIGQK